MNRIHTYSSAVVIAMALSSSPAIADIDTAVSANTDVGVDSTLSGDQGSTILDGGIDSGITADTTLSTEDDDDLMNDPDSIDNDPFDQDNDSPFENDAPGVSTPPDPMPDSDQPDVIDTDSADNSSMPANDGIGLDAGVGVDLDVNSSVGSEADLDSNRDSMNDMDDDIIESEPLSDQNSNAGSGSLSTRTEIEAETDAAVNR